MNELSTPMNICTFCAPSCPIADDVTEGATVNNRTIILIFSVGTTSAGSLCASACSLGSGMRTELSFDSNGDALGKVVEVNELSILVTASSFREPSSRLRRECQKVTPRSRALILVGLRFSKSRSRQRRRFPGNAGWQVIFPYGEERRCTLSHPNVKYVQEDKPLLYHMI